MRADRPRPARDIPAPAWEIGAAAAAAWLLAAALLLPGARALAGVAAGDGWVWPPDALAVLTAVRGLAHGDYTAGLRPAAAHALPSAAVGYAVISAGELTLLAVTVAVGRLWWQRSAVRAGGMATPRQIAVVLGTARLVRAAPLIRPELAATAEPDSPEPRRERDTDRIPAAEAGWRLGHTGGHPHRALWVPFDRTCGVYGPQGSGKTLDLLVPALLAAPGPALVTTTKAEDVLLTLQARAGGGRPVAVLDPFDAVPGLPELVWDPVDGCADPLVAERRARAFTAGTLHGAVTGGAGGGTARFYAFEAAKVLQAYFHAAALTGRSLEHLLEWAAQPQTGTEPEDILRAHPLAAPHWDGLLRGALRGDPRTAGNTATTVQQALRLFFQPEIRRRCVPGARATTDVAGLLAAGGTIYLLGRDDPYASATPLMTALAEHVLDTALQLADTAPAGRLSPPLLACLDELPSTAPLPTLRTRMANDRALGISFLYAAQGWRQLALVYGEPEARTLFALTNVLIVFGGGKDVAFNRELSELLGTTRVARASHTTGRSGRGMSVHGEDVPVLRPEQLRGLPAGRALVLAEHAPPLVARLASCLDGPAGQALVVAQADTRAQVRKARDGRLSSADLALRALAEAERAALTPDLNAGRIADPTAEPVAPDPREHRR